MVKFASLMMVSIKVNLRLVTVLLLGATYLMPTVAQIFK
uniref:Uncharacterized protein n=1 Tax=Siphoviridae sp. ct0Wl9 TaxID=2827763 RepID=A0A8S5T9K8_9CAUD|nr:MAG TPA: hypothetical protein [Siphoviridae sp. ct0Wl9]